MSQITERNRSVPTLSDLAQFSSFVAPYQSSGLVVTKSYAAAHPDTLKAFIAATIRGQRFAADPANKATVIADIAATFQLTRQLATDVYTTGQSPATSENPDEKINVQGLINVIDLRKEFNGFNKSVDSQQLAEPDSDGLYNDTYWQQALDRVDNENGN